MKAKKTKAHEREGVKTDGCGEKRGGRGRKRAREKEEGRERRGEGGRERERGGESGGGMEEGREIESG